QWTKEWRHRWWLLKEVIMRPNPAKRCLVAVVVAMTTAAMLILGAVLPATALATHWTEVPFPPERQVEDLVQDSHGKIWATTYTVGSDGQSVGAAVLVFRNGASSWEDGSAGIAGDWTAQISSLLSVGDKLFLNADEAGVYARSVEDASWHLISAEYEPLVFEIFEWAGYVWSGGGGEGVWRLDPETETWETMNDGLPIVGDYLEETRAVFQTRGNDDYLYAGFTVDGSRADDPDFPGVGVYRLKSGGHAWEDTGLRVQPLESDFQLPEWGSDVSWGIWHVIAVNGYALCEVDASIAAYEVYDSRLFLFDEQGGTWTPVAPPSSEVGRYSVSGYTQDCFTWDGEFWFVVGSTGDAALFDVFDPVSQSWRTGVTKPAIAWEPVGYIADWIAGELLVEPRAPTKTPSASPGFVPSVPLPTQISKDPEVIGTNFALALIFAAIFGFTSTLFNNTVKTKNAEIVRTLEPLTRRLTGVGKKVGGLLGVLRGKVKAVISRPAPFRRLSSGVPRMSRRRLEPVAIIIIAGLIYGLLDPGFGFSTYGLIIFVSLALSVAVVTYSYEGVQALTCCRRYRAPAAVKLFPIAIGIAIVCVILSRLTGFRPGYLYGFVGGMAFLGAQQVDDRKKARLVLIASGCLFAVSLAAWLLALPVTNAVEAGSSWLKVLQGVCVATFVAGLEGLLFGLVPLNFMDGGTLFRWNKWVWGGVFGVAVFLFWHVLLNKNSKYGAAFSQTSAKVVIALLVFWTVVTMGTHWYFRKPRGKTPARPGGITSQ
ncbi:MAG TPA: FGLLP motif-containing membrane protein, partial [Thermoleophilia bacterium]|nr:FGLLP motif-containing membrane protein [Thermoleophilia bacterium]